MMPSFSSPFQVTEPAQTSTGLGFSFGQTPAAGTGGISGSSILGQGNFGKSISSQSTAMAQEVPITNPFGALPSTPQMSIGRSGAGSSIQYGISSMPIVDRPAPVKVSSLISPRYLSLRHARLPAKKYRPNYDASKVMFFTNDEETQSMPKADASFIPRENPRALVISPIEQRPLRASTSKSFPTGNASAPPQEDGIKSEVHISTSNSNDTEAPITGQISDNDPVEAQVHLEHDRVYGFITQAPITGQISDNDPVEAQVHQEHNRVYGGHSVRREDAYMTVGGHRAGEAAIAYEHGADIEALMPKLRRSDYYTDPPIKELAAKKRAEPGFCHRIKDFVVGRHGYGSIRFFGLTDVRGLDLESLVQFNNREVIVYMDDNKKPPIGQGLNKPAEVTLLNIKCVDKKTGHQCTEGPGIEKYKEMLRKKAEEQGAKFVSYDPVKGEWKFRVKHFSRYKLQNVEETDGDV